MKACKDIEAPEDEALEAVIASPGGDAAALAPAKAARASRIDAAGSSFDATAARGLDATAARGLDATAARGLGAAAKRSPAVELDRFLRDVEGRAYRIALLSLRDREDALDAVQDAMLRLVRRYAGRPSDEWRPLFYRILQNRVRDLQRRRGFRVRVLGLFTGRDERDDAIADAPAPVHADPLEQASATNAMAALEHALGTLPARQREAFVLRGLEGLDVAQTAAAMRCTEGSVKTHYSRAVHRLRALLGAHVEDER